jgi:hypothetical protein
MRIGSRSAGSCSGAAAWRDLYGQRRLFVGGIGLFTGESLACGLAGLAGDADRRLVLFAAGFAGSQSREAALAESAA